LVADGQSCTTRFVLLSVSNCSIRRPKSACS